MASPRHFLSSSPDTSGRAGVRGGPERAHATQESAEGLGKAPGAAWPVSIHVDPLLEMLGGIPWGASEGEGAGGHRQRDGKEGLSAGGSGGSCPQETAAAIPAGDFNSSFDHGRPITSSTVLAPGSAADVCAERPCHKDTTTQSRQDHKEGAAGAGMGNQGSSSLGTLASM